MSTPTESAGGLTEDEAYHLYRLMVAHSMDTAVSSYRGHPDDPTLESVLSAELARIGFTRLTDAEITAGCLAVNNDVLDSEDRVATEAEVAAAFRRAVAEAREAGK